MPLYEIHHCAPHIHESAYVADSADLIGAIEISEGCSVWSHVAMRGDNELIRIGKNSNIQEGCVLHTDPGAPLFIGQNVTVGHQAMLHGCSIDDGALIGIQAIVLNGAKIGKNCLVGAGALITENKEFPDGMLILGSPAKAIRPLTELEISHMHLGTASYVVKAQAYKAGLKRLA